MYSIVSPFPVSESILCYFASFLGCQQLSPQSIKTYLSGIRHTQITLGLPDPRQFSSLPRLHLVQAGIQRMYTQQNGTSKQIRLPITPSILLQLRAYWNQHAGEPDSIMLWAASTLCFFGFFRSGELTLRALTAFNPAHHLAWGDIAIDNRSSPKVLKVRLKTSKCDQTGRGVDVYVGRTEGPLCPVAAVLNYMAIRGTAQGPFFMTSTGQPLIKAAFIAKVRHALKEIGLPYECFAGHSFRIGAATTAAKLGLEDSLIRTLGRWNSDAYIRTPREHLAQYSRTLTDS